MSMQTISTQITSNLSTPFSLAPAFIKQFAPRQVDVKVPKVSVTTFFSMSNLCQITTALDSRFGSNLGIVIELPVHSAPQFYGLSRTANFGGQLAIVVPTQSRLTLPLLASDSEELQIAGWDVARQSSTIDHAIAGMLDRNSGVQRCFVLHPEWHDPTPIHLAIGRHITR